MRIVVIGGSGLIGSRLVARLAAACAAGVDHHVALSIVGADRMLGSGYMRAEVAQEELIRGRGVPWTVLRATPFMDRRTSSGAVPSSSGDRT
jgi:uncharacterized protein YbjT (DUF2867 family)